MGYLPSGSGERPAAKRHRDFETEKYFIESNSISVCTKLFDETIAEWETDVDVFSVHGRLVCLVISPIVNKLQPFEIRP